MLRYFEDLTEQQVADLLGISVGTVKSHAHKALAGDAHGVPGPGTRHGR